MLTFTHTMAAITLTLAIRTTAAAQDTATERSVAPADSTLRQELLRLAEVDQKVREDWIKSMSSSKVDTSLQVRMDSVDSASTARMKEIVRRRGWPGKPMVGEDGSEAAFLLVQHSADTLFQRTCLPLLEAAFRAGEVSGQDLALLTDRVRVREGKLQLYGSQAQIVDGKLVLNPIEDEANVDKRRAEIGLPPMAEYVKMLEQMYHMQVK